MAAWVVVFVASALFVGLFALGLSLTLIFKGHHIESEISTNPNMKRLGIKCAVEEAREAAGADCEGPSCGGNCAGCDSQHDDKPKTAAEAQ